MDNIRTAAMTAPLLSVKDLSRSPSKNRCVSSPVTDAEQITKIRDPPRFARAGSPSERSKAIPAERIAAVRGSEAGNVGAKNSVRRTAAANPAAAMILPENNFNFGLTAFHNYTGHPRYAVPVLPHLTICFLYTKMTV